MQTIRAFYESHQKGVSADDAGLNEIAPFLTPVPGAVFLDIGCFDGFKTAAIRDLIGAHETWGVDFVSDWLAQAREHGIQTKEIDLNSGKPLDFPALQFDVIICSEVIEHVYSPDDLLDEIARLLKPGGYAILTTPNLASWKNRIALLLGWQPFLTEVSTRARYGNPFTPPGRPSGHIRVFTLRALLEMARAAGLQPVRIGGAALRSPAQTVAGWLSRSGDVLLTRFPALADRMIVRLEKS
jgi:2-polyprenyl-3-methyl-5-hydroxy-6-metoxy-1,4-benzoquinol methylase